jgi:integrase
LYCRGKIWYAQIKNPATGKYMPGRSTGKRSEKAAERVADEWLENGIPELTGKTGRPLSETLDIDTVIWTIRQSALTPTDAERIVRTLKDRELIETTTVKAGPGAEGLLSFLGRFWDFEGSPYIRDKLAHGHRIGRRHCYDMTGWVRTCWEPFFGKAKQLGELRKSDMKDFSLWLAEERKLKAKSINTALSAGTVALRWAHAEELIPSNPAAGLVKFSGTPAKRGVLTEDEVRQLFEAPWAEERARLGNMLAMTTGLRAGEILAIQVRDIEEDRLRVRHSWSGMDGLKSPKTGKERSVPLLVSLRGPLLELARRNPAGMGPATFVFWSTDRADRPMDFHFLLHGLKDALVAMLLTEEDREIPEKVEAARGRWKGRAIVFHSWRHYYAARMADRLESRKVMLATGHANGAVFESYADHATAEVFEEVRAAATEAFGQLVPFRK